MANTDSAEFSMEDVFDETDKNVFKSLNSHTSRLLANLSPCPDVMKAHITAYGQQVRAYIFSHQESTGTSKRPFTHGLENHIMQQATPSVLSLGCALMTTIGYELGVDDRSETRFIDSARDSAKLVRACHNHMEHWERSSGSLDIGAARRMTDAGHLPFVSLFPWYEQDQQDFVFASRILLWYLQKTKPLIVLAYGSLPTYLAYASFEALDPDFFYEKKLKVDNRPDLGLGLVGTPELCKLGPNGDDVVVIPALHVDYPAKGAETPHQGHIPEEVAARLCMLTHQIAWFAMDVALRCDKDTSRTWSREQICRTVMKEVNQILGLDHKFGRDFDFVKNRAIYKNLLDDDPLKAALGLRYEFE
jgi:hypothetical protein